MRAAGSLEKLLELADRDEAAGLGDAPWPPHFRKMEGEGTRVAPSRARSAAKKPAAKKKRTRMPLLVIANSPDKKAALEGLERWKAKYPKVAKLLAVDDVLVDSMRGRSSTWTRIRVNLRNVPEKLRPPQETPTPTTTPRASGAKPQRRTKTVATKMHKSHKSSDDFLCLLCIFVLLFCGKDQFEFVRRHDFELRVSAVGRFFVSAPAAKLRRVTKTISLHVLVSNFNHELGSQWLPRHVLAMTPATLRARHSMSSPTSPMAHSFHG